MTTKQKSYELGCRLVTGPRETVVPQAVHESKHLGKMRTQKHKHKNTFTIIQLNVCGISNKKVEISKMLNDTRAHVLLLQESLHQSCNPHISGYTSYPCTCTNCSGILTYIRNDVQGVVENLTQSNPTDIQRITIWFEDNKYNIFNIYNPPANKFDATSIQWTDNKTILCGDFNGHSPRWGYSDRNYTGRSVEELCDSSNLCLLQDAQSTPTLLHRAHKTLYRPDLTIISADLLNKTHFQVLDDVGSDHKPILSKITSGDRKQLDRKPRWNFRKANWENFRTSLDEKLKHQDTSNLTVEELNTVFTTAILDASSTNISRGCRKIYKPFWNKEIEEAVKNRKIARKHLEEAPNLENKIKFNKASAVVKRTTKQAKREKWTNTCANLNLKTDGKKAWALLNNLNNEKGKQNPKPMQTKDELLTCPQKKAKSFNRFFANVNKAHNLNEKDREMIKGLKSKEKSPTANTSLSEEDFSLAELDKALKKLKLRKSPGPDKVHNEMLLQLSRAGKEVLLCLINKTWQTNTIPKAWKNSIIIPILKKDKPSEEMKSYRPISLTSCISKLAERMINNRLYWWLETSGFLNANQAGFRTGQRTEDQLFRLTQKIVDGFQEKMNTTAIFVDLQQAYDRVWRKGLFIKMNSAGIHGKLYRWIKGFLTERTISTKVENRISSKETLEEGLPQGSCLSCTLFLIYINDMPDILQSEKALYADDLAMWYTSKYLPITSNRLNEDLNSLHQYCEKWKLKINSTKTVYTIFTQSPKISKKTLNLKIGNEQLQKEDNPSYLGVELDHRLTLQKHTQNIQQKCTKRLKLVKRLASTTWGADKNTLRQLYLGYVRSAMEYCLPLQSISSKSAQNTIDKIQHQAIRHISGGMKSTPIAACEIHTNIEPLDLRREASVVEMVERYKRLDNHHPNKQLIDKWESRTRLKKKSTLHVAQELEMKYHLPQHREQIKTVDRTPPNKTLLSPIIKCSLIQPNTDKRSDAKQLHTIAEETIQQYPNTWIHVYTDGSAHKGTYNAGYGALFTLPDNTTEELYNPCGTYSSNHEAEAVAIEASLRHLSNTFNIFPDKTKNVVIFSDSKSTLDTLDSKNYSSSTINSLAWEIHHFLGDHQITLVLQWIPGHSNIQGNECADLLAKKGTSLPQPNPSCSQQTAKQIIKSNKNEEWLNRWALGNTGRRIFPYMAKPLKNDNINHLTRHQQVIIFRLRTQHTILNDHLSKITSNTEPTCPLCQHPNETVHHHLFECKPLQDLRKSLLPPNPDLHNTLYTNTKQLRNTCNFFVMANNRRANAQVVTGSDK